MNISYLDLLIILFALVRGSPGCNNRSKEKQAERLRRRQCQLNAGCRSARLASDSLLATSSIRVPPVAAGIMI
ncbi:MAG: hypothetical protein IPH73_11675 [Rhodocyclales bacterium]|nr:hypothetical protein [Rhodocyclales bacterium]